ncbi:hypothetical protein DFP72DRAFT_912166 [Ephemerocybe angulata]|uniref:Uncharacterized protein n=1 Tax=Ephemerocybe angulata TaxID=980116 RepID=A0A8H6M393_9AGAR|nr:hypothetical protein DFP72DRAFT_912166 [Tulosesus angulatus]
MVNAAQGDVLTATRFFQEIVSQSPFIVTRTTVVTWTYGPHTLSSYLSNLLTHLFLNSQSSSITESTPIPTVPDTIEAPPAMTQG